MIIYEIPLYIWYFSCVGMTLNVSTLTLAFKFKIKDNSDYSEKIPKKIKILIGWCFGNIISICLILMISVFIFILIVFPIATLISTLISLAFCIIIYFIKLNIIVKRLDQARDKPTYDLLSYPLRLLKPLRFDPSKYKRYKIKIWGIYFLLVIVLLFVIPFFII